MRIPAVLALGVGLFALAGGCRKPAGSPAPPRPGVFKGDTVALKFPKKDTVPVFLYLDTLDEFLVKLGQGADPDYFLIRYGARKFLVPAGTQAVVLDNRPDRYQVEVSVENETGKTGWVAAAWAEKVASAPKP
jgi:hypothetical protein